MIDMQQQQQRAAVTTQTSLPPRYRTPAEAAKQFNLWLDPCQKRALACMPPKLSDQVRAALQRWVVSLE